PPRSRLADPYPRSRPLPVDIGGTERRRPPRCPGPAPSRRPGPLRHGALARSPTPARPRHADPIPRSHPLPVDIGGTERRVSPRCPDLAPSRRLAAPAGPAARAQQRAPCLASLGLAALRLASLCASPPRSVPPGVGAEREGALGAASALDGVIGHDAVEEPVAAARVGGAQVTAVGRGAQRVPPIHDVAPAGSGERAAELLDRER